MLGGDSWIIQAETSEKKNKEMIKHNFNEKCNNRNGPKGSFRFKFKKEEIIVKKKKKKESNLHYIKSLPLLDLFMLDGEPAHMSSATLYFFSNVRERSIEGITSLWDHNSFPLDEK